MPTPISNDPEIIAMASVIKLLEDLSSPEAAQRVLTYAASRLILTVPNGTHAAVPSVGGSHNSTDVPEFQFASVADLFEAVQPNGEMAKACTVAYWFQVIQGSADWDSQTVNGELKHLGHGVSNITKVLDRLMGKKPQLVIQTRKSGSSQQARKRYKLTVQGVRWVEEQLRGQGSAL